MCPSCGAGQWLNYSPTERKVTSPRHTTIFSQETINWEDKKEELVCRKTEQLALYTGGSVVGYTSAFVVAAAGSITASPTCPFFGQAVLSKESATPWGNRRLLPVSIAQFMFFGSCCMRAEVSVWLDTLSRPRSIQPKQSYNNSQ